MTSRNSIRTLIVLSLGVLSLGLFSPAAFGGSVPNQWTWMGGSKTAPTCSYNGVCGQPGVYGTKGTFAAANVPGGRSGPSAWTDSSGHFWLFGGYGYDSAGNLNDLNDLWEYNPSTKQWAWMGGSSTMPTCTGGSGACPAPGTYGTLGQAAAGNVPGGRKLAAVWTDSKGNFWLFGGSGVDSTGATGYLNDLWEFDPTTKEWIWMGGSNTITTPDDYDGHPGVYGVLGVAAAGNIPGSRSDASTWVDDSGHFWLYGGYGHDSLGDENQLDDLWELNPDSNEWTWMGGSYLSYAGSNPGVYGTLGVASAVNHPGAREGSATWTDKSGNLWLFGGFGRDANDIGDPLDDLWEFSPSTDEWTWVSGSSTVPGVYVGIAGDYGTLGVFAAGNIPEGRGSGVAWTDSSGGFWIFGGSVDGVVSYEALGYLNDVWELEPSTKEWAWMGRTIATCQQCKQPGVYGTLGTAGEANNPGGRVQMASWLDSSGHLWIFGGQGNDSAGTPGLLNDLWEYSPVTNPPTTITPTVTVSPSPSSITSTQALTITVTISGGSGHPVPTGSVTLTGGGYTSAGTTMSGGIATIDIAAQSLLPAVDTLTAYYTPDSASVSTYNAATGSATIHVASTTAAIAPTVSLSALEYGIWTTESLPVTIHVYGGTQTATGSVVLKGGTFTSEAVTLGGTYETGGPVTIVIPGGSLPAGADTLTAVYSPDSKSTESYTSATGTTKVTVSVEPANGLYWTWMGGDNIIPGYNTQGGVYGTRGVAAADNYPGGRINFSSWTDSSGNFWLFGGEGNDGDNQHVLLNDLWKLNPSTKEWTWVSGSNVYAENPQSGGNDAPGVYGTEGTFAAANVPGSRIGASTWVDSSGHLWLFGGYGFIAGLDSGPLNDLWEFNPTTAEWAWISGDDFVVGQQEGVGGVYGTLGVAAAGNAPAARQNATSWIDKSGNLWLFGGYPQDVADYGCDESDLNDVWKFSPTTKEWTWMGGSAPTFTGECYDNGPAPAAGVYGTLGTPAAANIPGGRDGAMGWTDSNGNFWLFGGSILWDSYGQGTYNDLWEFNPTTNEWTWISGSNTLVTYTQTYESSSVGRAGIYGTSGTAAAANVPGSRAGASTWIDSSNDLWLFGGSGLDSNGAPHEMNDMWKFNSTTKQWTWLGGTSTFPPVFAYPGPVGIYGTLGVAASPNTPGGRYQGASWTDKSGHMWLFGGESWDAVGQNGWFNDLWEYVPGMAPAVTLSASSVPFGSVKVGTASGSASVTLTNTGNEALTISSIAITGADASSFVFAESCGTSLAAGANCSIHGHFAPAAEGSLTAAITVGDNAAGSPQTISLSGTGLAPVVKLSASSLAFGSEKVGMASGSQSVTVTNTGDEALSITSISITGTDASSFVFANSCGTSLAVAASCSIHGHFAPAAVGALTAAISITDSAGNSPQKIALSGTGASVTTVKLSATSLAFGTVKLGAASGSGSVTLTNTGNAALAITSIAVTGTDASSFVFANTCGTSLAAGASCSIHGHFAPAAVGALTAAITITDDATGSPPSIALSGTGEGVPAVKLSATSLAFGDEKVGVASGSQSVTLTNSGSAALTITSINVTGADASSWVFANSCGTSLAVAASCTVHGHFAPAATGALTAAITIVDNAAGSPQSIALSGTGQ